MQAPQRDADGDAAKVRHQGQRQIGSGQQDQSRRKQSPAIEAVGQHPGGIGRQRINDVHPDENGGHPHHAQPNILGAQDQEGFAETRQRKYDADHHHAPVDRPEAFDRLDTQWIFGPADTGWPRRFLDREQDQRQRQKCRNDRDPEHRLEIIRRPPHQADGEQRADKGSHGIERLAQAEAGAPHLRRRDIGDQRIARRAADALADAIDKARRHQPAYRGRQREHRLGERGQPIAYGREEFALAKPIGERARKYLGDRRGGFGDAFDEADGQHRGA